MKKKRRVVAEDSDEEAITPPAIISPKPKKKTSPKATKTASPKSPKSAAAAAASSSTSRPGVLEPVEPKSGDESGSASAEEEPDLDPQTKKKSAEKLYPQQSLSTAPTPPPPSLRLEINTDIFQRDLDTPHLLPLASQHPSPLLCPSLHLRHHLLHYKTLGNPFPPNEILSHGHRIDALESVAMRLFDD